MSTQKCLELFLDDVVSVLVYRAADCTISIPPTVPCLRNATFTANQQPVFQANIAISEDQIQMEQPPTLKISNARSAAGHIYTHDLQLPVFIGREQAEVAVNQLQGTDFYIVYYRSDGSHEISYSLPNTSVADIDEQFANNISITLKLKVQSLSQLVKLN